MSELMWAAQELRFAPNHAERSVSGPWEVLGSFICRSCRRSGHGLKNQWTNKELACWHFAWHRSSLCPLAQCQPLSQGGVRQGTAQAPCPKGCMNEATLFLAEERWARGLGIAWHCSSSGLKNWLWSNLFTWTDTVISSRDFVCLDTTLDIHSRKTFFEDRKLPFSTQILFTSDGGVERGAW